MDYKVAKKKIGRAPIFDPATCRRSALLGSSQTAPRHTHQHSYRCYLPVLTEFGSLTLRGIRLSAPSGPTETGK